MTGVATMHREENPMRWESVPLAGESGADA